MRSIFNKKHFKNSGLTPDMFSATHQLELEQIAKDYYPLPVHKVKIIAGIAINRPGSIYQAFVNYLQVIDSGVDPKLKSSLEYIYGSELGQAIHNKRSEKIANSRRKVEDYAQGYVNSIKILKERGINWDNLTEKQQVRARTLLDFCTSKQRKYVKNTLAWFIVYDLTNYVGRYKRIQSVGQTSLYSYVLRYGKHTGYDFWKSHSAQKTQHFTNKTAHWIAQGYTENQAQDLVQQIQKDRNLKSTQVLKGTSEFTVRSLAYWLKKGASIDEAKAEVKRVQQRSKSPETIAKWLETLDNKSYEEKSLINLKRSHTIKGIMARGYDEEIAAQMSYEYFSKRRNYSLVSQKLFEMVKDGLGEQGLYYKTFNYEKQFNRFLVDFFDQLSGTVIEFFGDFWHANPLKYPREVMIYNKPASLVWLDDKRRLHAINSHVDVNHLYVVWETEFRNNPTEIARHIIHCIQEHRNERGKHDTHH